MVFRNIKDLDTNWRTSEMCSKYLTSLWYVLLQVFWVFTLSFFGTCISWGLWHHIESKLWVNLQRFKSYLTDLISLSISFFICQVRAIVLLNFMRLWRWYEIIRIKPKAKQPYSAKMLVVIAGHNKKGEIDLYAAIRRLQSMRISRSILFKQQWDLMRQCGRSHWRRT